MQEKLNHIAVIDRPRWRRGSELRAALEQHLPGCLADRGTV